MSKFIRYEMIGIEPLAELLKKKSMTDYRKVERKNLLEMRNRAVRSSDPSSGGTPVGNYKGGGQLRLSAQVNAAGDTFGYTKDYAPHVEYGHRLVRNGVTYGYVPGQYFLRTNVRIQQPIFRQDLVKEMRK